MASINDRAEKRKGLPYFRPFDLKPMPSLNVRDFSFAENIEHVQAIKASIRQDGFMETEPLTIRPGSNDEIWIVDGECRWRACMELIAEGFEPDMSIPCIQEPSKVNDADRTLNMMKANSNKPFNPVEISLGVKRAISLGKSPQSVAASLGKSASWVHQMMDLQGAPEIVKNEVGAGRISATEAVKVVRREGDAASDIVKQAVEAARASGKKKATGKHVSRSAPGSSFKVIERGGGNLAVSIDGKKFLHPWKFWRGLADEIAEAIEKAESFRAEQASVASEAALAEHAA